MTAEAKRSLLRRAMLFGAALLVASCEQDPDAEACEDAFIQQVEKVALATGIQTHRDRAETTASGWMKTARFGSKKNGEVVVTAVYDAAAPEPLACGLVVQGTTVSAPFELPPF